MENSFIPPIMYSGIYIVLVALISISQIAGFNINRKNPNNRITYVIICLFFIIFLGTRPISPVFADMPLYKGLYDRWDGTFEFNWENFNLLFDNLELYLASIRFDPTLHYIMFAAIYFICILLACKKLFPNHITLAFICYCARFSTFSYCVNGYKAGSAAVLFLIALAYRDNLKISIPFVLMR